MSRYKQHDPVTRGNYFMLSLGIAGKETAARTGQRAGLLFHIARGALATIPSGSFRVPTSRWGPGLRFLRHQGIYRSDGALNRLSSGWSFSVLPTAPTASKGTNRNGLAPLIVSMSSCRLFLDRVGRHQSPSPLRRLAQITMHSASAGSKPELSTLLRTGTFYFALTGALVDDLRAEHDE